MSTLIFISKAVLVAISIPIFTSQLEKSRENTDLANLRAAKAAAVTAYITADPNDAILGDAITAGTGSVECYYNAAQGKLAIQRSRGSSV